MRYEYIGIGLCVTAVVLVHRWAAHRIERNLNAGRAWWQDQ